MTNGPGKSDRPTVPEKFPNNAGQPAAEGMEGRGRAKGNLLQFIIKYTAIDDASSSFYWVSSFTVDALTGAVLESY